MPKKPKGNEDGAALTCTANSKLLAGMPKKPKGNEDADWLSLVVPTQFCGRNAEEAERQ